jgi:AbrB family looped-hinge helix DNA binding protein
MTKEGMMSAQPVQSVRVQKKGQVTIPLEIRQKLNLEQGDLVTFVETEAGVVLKPVAIKPAELIVAEALDQIGAALEEKGISLEDMIKRGREIRGDLIEEEYGLTDSPAE